MKLTAAFLATLAANAAAQAVYTGTAVCDTSGGASGGPDDGKFTVEVVIDTDPAVADKGVQITYTAPTAMGWLGVGFGTAGKVAGSYAVIWENSGDDNGAGTASEYSEMLLTDYDGTLLNSAETFDLISKSDTDGVRTVIIKRPLVGGPGAYTFVGAEGDIPFFCAYGTSDLVNGGGDSATAAHDGQKAGLTMTFIDRASVTNAPTIPLVPNQPLPDSSAKSAYTIGAVLASAAAFLMA